MFKCSHEAFLLVNVLMDGPQCFFTVLEGDRNIREAKQSPVCLWPLSAANLSLLKLVLSLDPQNPQSSRGASRAGSAALYLSQLSNKEILFHLSVREHIPWCGK